MLKKKELTSVDVAVVVCELRDRVSESRVTNIYQTSPGTFIFKLHKANEPPMQLLMETGRRLHLTSYAVEKPRSPPAFCMALRKYLRNAKLVNVAQQEFERIVLFRFSTGAGQFKLILELFGEGNILLTDEGDRILQALVFKRMRDRNILRGERYRFPPTAGKNPFNVGLEELEEAFKAAGAADVVRTLVRFIAIGGVYAEEVLLRAGIPKTTQCSDLSHDKVTLLFSSLQNLLLQVSSGKTRPCVVYDENNDLVDAVPFELELYRGYKTQEYASFNEALDEFFTRASASASVLKTEQREALMHEAERLKRVINEQEKAVREAESAAETDKRVGDYIYANLNLLQTLLDRFNKAKAEGKNLQTVVSEILSAKNAGGAVESLFEFFDPRNLLVTVSADNLRFSLNLRRTLFENAAEFYERSKKARQKATGAKAALDDSTGKLREIEQQLAEIDAATAVESAGVSEKLEKRRIKPKQWCEKFRWFQTSDGFLVVAGKDAVTNEVLIKKYTDPSDVVFHADIQGAPFVVVKATGKTLTEQATREAAEFAAAFSRAWRESLGSVDVYWVKPDQLRKGGSSGEYVPHGAFVVTGKRNWLRNVPLKLAIGVIVNDEASFVSGPEESVKAKTNCYVLLVPGDVAGKTLFKQIAHALAQKAGKLRKQITAVTAVENIREHVPYAKGRIANA